MDGSGVAGASIGDVTPDDVRRATGRFTAGLDGADPGAPIPACPGWTVRELVAHLGEVHVWAAAIVASGEQASTSEDPPGDDLRGWYAERAARLVDVLAATDPDRPCWNFAGVDERAGFWSRRQVHETQMHHVDLDQAAGRTPQIDPADAADGVAETFEVFGPRMHARGHPADLTGPVSLVATDTGDTWTLTPEHDSHPRLTRGDTADDRLEGRAEDLWLLLWKRRDDGVMRRGDRDRLDRLLASRLSG